MKIGIIGSGDVGQKLGHGFIQSGHEVAIGTRDPSAGKLNGWQAEAGERGHVHTFAEAATFGEVLVLATAWSGTQHAIELADPKNFAGKVVLDATNPLQYEEGQPLRLALGHTDSAGEQVQRWLPDAHVVKAFNITGNGNFYKPNYPNGPAQMFIAGNDADAKKTVAEICDAFGWQAEDIGGIEGARYLEPLAMVWIHHAFTNKEYTHSFGWYRR